MNPFLNPLSALPFLKDYLTIPRRLNKISFKKIKEIKDKNFKKIVRYAYTVPVYHHKYKKAGIHPNDIRGIDDIKKLPFITKKEILEAYPDGIIPKGYNKENANVISTSGSSGKPLSFFIDFSTIRGGIFVFLRETYNYNFKWRKFKYVCIGDFSKGKFDQIVNDIYISKTDLFRKPSNMMNLNAFEDIKIIIKKLDEFKPDYIISYPVIFQQLAFFKKKGYAKNLNPKLLNVGGYVLDDYTKDYVEDVFKCKMLNVYGCAETVSNIAFECTHNIWHINDDLFHIEAFDENMNLVAPGKRGHIVMTRLFGKGTPFIRYTGLDDWVTLEQDYQCNCGFRSAIIKYGVEGRISTNVVLPDGRIFPAAAFVNNILPILKELKTYKVTQFQIIQKKIDSIEIHLVIDEDLRSEGPSVDLIFKKIKDAYEKLCGPDVKIDIIEVKEIKTAPGKPLSLVISNVKLEDGLDKIKW
jgi:phenylacetate-CoA ligase